VVALALAFTAVEPSTLNAQSQTPSPAAAPIVVPSPTVIPVTQPIRFSLSPAQIAEIVSALSGAGISLPSGVKGLNLRIITTGTNAGGAWVQLRFQ
jgi:hypothetical protein